MKYLSIDIEATGLRENDLIIEFACVPFCSVEKKILSELTFHSYLKCPSFEELKPFLDQWVIENNQTLITKASTQGKSIADFKNAFTQYLESTEVKNFFNNEKIVLFGKSMNAIDLPFMNRDFGWEWMRKNFSHRVVDFSSVCYGMIDLGILPKGSESGSKLMSFLKMGGVAHTALEDAVNTAKMYLAVIDLSKEN